MSIEEQIQAIPHHKPGVPFIPESAPFSPKQRQFLNGLLAGLFSARLNGTTGTGNTALTLTILVGTESGNCMTLAKQLKKKATSAGFSPIVLDLADFDPESLQSLGHIAVLTSTHGDGNPPENAQLLYDYLHGDNAPDLSSLNYSVLALGDSNYAKFCQCGKDLDKRLEELGAKRLYERVDCDVDFEPPFEAWANGFLATLKTEKTSVEAIRTSPVSSPRLVQSSAKPAQSKGYNRRNPFTTKLIKSVNLNGEGSQKETRHCEISLQGSDLRYEPGDALGVFPRNCPALVQDILQALNFDGEEAVETPGGEQMPLRYALEHRYEIRSLKASLLRRIAGEAKIKALELLLSEERREDLEIYLHDRELIDLLMEYPGSIRSPHLLISILEPLQPRLYSIASDQEAAGGDVHLTVGVVRYQSHGRQRKGVCSSFLAERAGTDTLRVFVQPNRNFRLPADPTTPIIMVGPGTGIAPFRSFLQARQRQENRGASWLFFGDRNSQCDFLYRDELEALQSGGTLTKLSTAWSRDQGEKVYVQNRMQEESKEIYKWLQRGAHFYVCGDASRMARDVESALLDIIIEHGGKSAGDARAYLEILRNQKRYQRDVY